MGSVGGLVVKFSIGIDIEGSVKFNFRINMEVRVGSLSGFLIKR